MSLKRLKNRFVRPALLACALALGLASGTARAEDSLPAFRPPAVPLVTFDPFLSVWSEADKLTDDVPRHWTHRPHPLVSLIRIDGRAYRLMGNTPDAVPALPQTGVRVLPTRSIYDFDNGQVHVTLTFMTPALPHDLDVLARPVTYLTWSVKSVDGASHDVALYDSVSSLLTVNQPSETVTWQRGQAGSLAFGRTGTVEQAVLGMGGDDVRVNWGYAYLAATGQQAKFVTGANDSLTRKFAAEGTLLAGDDTRQPRAANDAEPVVACTFDLGKVGAAPVSRHALVAYDEVYAIKYFGQKLRPYWARNGATIGDLLQTAEKEYAGLNTRCIAFDREFMADLKQAGGERYMHIATLAYRQCLAGNGLAADANKQPLLFTKENTSNGDIATVDVIFPMSPMMLWLSPTLSKAMLVSNLDYAASPRWKFPNAPHDLGTYPIARGTDDGGEGMPVEESGNMLLMCDAIARSEGNARFVAKWWPQLTQWEQYLEKYGNDPEEQLCTDDFMGHLAHNANLSVKAILAIAAYGDLCRMRGDAKTADRVQTLARNFAQHWTMAANDGDHYRLAFDKPNTWSQKYNLVWDKILGLNVFPSNVARQEVAYYKKVMQPYGVPLDSRTRLTKTDWSLWTATMADDQADFEAMIAPIYDYLNTTTARMPLVDSYVTDNIKSSGMHARPVVGGLFVKMLTAPGMWKKWASGDKMKVGEWAALPPRPVVTTVVATSQTTPLTWHYTTTRPEGAWASAGYDDSAWQTGQGAFGSPGTPGITPHTVWRSDDIWLRREFTLPAQINGNDPRLQFMAFHDEDIEVYVNGVPAAKEGGFVASYEPLEIGQSARALLKPGAKVVIAVHCHQTGGGQGVDVGLSTVTEGASK